MTGLPTFERHGRTLTFLGGIGRQATIWLADGDPGLDARLITIDYRLTGLDGPGAARVEARTYLPDGFGGRRGGGYSKWLPEAEALTLAAEVAIAEEERLTALLASRKA